MLAAVIGLYVATANSDAFDAGTFDFRAIVAAVANGQLGVEPGGAQRVVPRLHVRVRGQGAAVAVPPLAARRRRGGHPGDGGADDGRRRQGRHVRHAALLPAAVPRRVDDVPAVDHHARGDRHHLRRGRRDRPDRRDAPDLVHVDLALRLHHPRHLRDDQPGPVRVDALHGQPRHLDGRAVPDRRIPGVAQGKPGHRRLRRGAEGGAGPGGHVPGRRPGHAVAAGSGAVHQRVPGADRHVHPLSRLRGVRGDRPGAVGDLHPVDLPADDDRARSRTATKSCATWCPANSSWWPR